MTFNKLGTAQAERAAVRIGLPAMSYPKAIDETGWQAATRLTAPHGSGSSLSDTAVSGPPNRDTAPRPSSLCCELPASSQRSATPVPARPVRSSLAQDRKSTRLNSSHVKISYAVFCLKKKKKIINIKYNNKKKKKYKSR